ncbi:hypothetical protein BGZ73_008147 [Actinomortierella ambigua]|nr:hypothetical protein BGZ73_008147 [Actinomortierella ambigua]
MKSIKSAFIKIGKKDTKNKATKDKKKDTQSPSTPDTDKVDSNQPSNATTTSLHTIGVSEASSIHVGEGQVATGKTSSPVVPPVPSLPPTAPISPIVPQDVAVSVGVPTAVIATGVPETTAPTGFAQPHSAHQTSAIVVSTAPLEDTTPRPPANPQAVVTIPPRSDTMESTEPRSPHTIQGDNSNTLPDVATAATAPGVNLHRSDTLPPSYNSLHIPPSTSIHAASAPTPSGVAAVATMQPNETASENVMNTYVAPPPPSTASSPLVASSAGAPTPSINHQGSPYHTEAPLPPLPPGAAAAAVAHQQLIQQHYHHHQQSSSSSTTAPYPIPTQPPQPSPPQQQYVMPHHVTQPMSVPMAMPMPPVATPSAYSTTNYGHRPYVPPGSENTVYPIIMAIDWGTTFSSMAYAYQQDGEVHEVSTW